MADSETGGSERYNTRSVAVPANGERRWRSVRNHIEWEHEGGRRPVAMRS